MYVIRLSEASVVARPRTGAHYGAHANAGLAELQYIVDGHCPSPGLFTTIRSSCLFIKISRNFS
jgi:hypothetical protein